MTLGRPKVDEDKIPEILEMLARSCTEREICEKLNVSKGKVHRVKKSRENV